MVIRIDDTGSVAKLTIEKKGKIIYRKSGSIKSLLKMIYNGTKSEATKKAIIELQGVYPLMIGSKFKTTIKD